MVVINFIAMYNVSVGLVCLVLYFIFVSYVGRRGSRIVLNKALRVSTARDFIEFNSAKAVLRCKVNSNFILSVLQQSPRTY